MCASLATKNALKENERLAPLVFLPSSSVYGHSHGLGTEEPDRYPQNS
jgi:hypothetical protein